MTAIFSSQEFNQNPGRIKKAADEGPVIVTERGERKLVVLSWAQYERLTGSAPNIVELFHDPETAGIEFEPERFTGFGSPSLEGEAA